LRHVEGPIIVIWDNHQPHKSIEVQEIVKSSLGSLMIEYLPPYAPDLNPDEGVWSHLKTRELANSCAKDTKQLRRDLRLAVVRTRRREGFVEGIVQGTPLCMAGLLT
jgi:putative transposase